MNVGFERMKQEAVLVDYLMTPRTSAASKKADAEILELEVNLEDESNILSI